MPLVACPFCHYTVSLPDPWTAPGFTCPRCRANVSVAVPFEDELGGISSTKKWFVSVNGAKRGPFSSKDLVQSATNGQLQPTDRVWKEGMPKWIRLSKIRGLFPSNTPLPMPAMPVVIVPAAAPIRAPQLVATPLPVIPAQSPAEPLTLETVEDFALPSNRSAKRQARSSADNGYVWFKIVAGIFGVVTTGFFGFMIISTIGGKGGINFGGGSNSSGKAIKVSAIQLFEDYSANEVAADEKYKGKTLEISGMVNDIGIDITKTMYVTFNLGRQLEIMTVQCYFDDNHKGDLAKLSKGQSVMIRGSCAGKLFHIMVKDCELVTKK